MTWHIRIGRLNHYKVTVLLPDELEPLGDDSDDEDGEASSPAIGSGGGFGAAAAPA